MVAGVTGVVLLMWALVTVNLMIGAYARQKAHVDDKAQFLGFLLEGWIGEVHDLKEPAPRVEFQRKLSNLGMIVGWVVVSRDRNGALTVLLQHPEGGAISAEDERHLRSALEDKRVRTAGPRAYLPIAGVSEYAARLDFRAEFMTGSPLTSELWTSVAILLLGTVPLVFLTYILVNRIVLAPLTAIVEGSKRVSEGDYSRRIPAPPRRDEVGTMIQAFNSMMEKLDAYHQTLQGD